jgi:CheY-like chemotaxis protein/anti-sigma regulatory factor (Ser/Thr protein kinase)
MWNLLSNAVKFTRHGGRIDVSVDGRRDVVTITVADNGVGIDSAFLPHVFERFRQADSSSTRAQTGLGLGLAIVRHLVDLHGGDVAVYSDGPGKGSTFTVTLPTRAAAPHEVDLQHSTIGATSLSGIRVLAIDDDSDSRELIQLTVRAADGDVIAVSSAAKALDVIQIFRPHVVVSDLAMPGMDGYGLLHTISTTIRHPPPVIAISGHVSEREVQRSIEAGFARHLGKPADYERLVEAIAELAKNVNFAE